MIDLQGLVAEFARHVQAETEAAWRGDSKTANKHVVQCLAVFDKLRAHGDTGRDALTVLFTHPRMDVRVSAAALLLRHRTAEAKAVLKEAAKGKGLVPFEASQALKRWEEGTWALDPADDDAGPPEPDRPAPSSKRSRPRTQGAATEKRRGNKRDKRGG
ncbi:MAG TPA: DUF2019 domain-containing protein [Archangium sp.]|nr:DUF2019 domain-containing protein [Archangium sp.]